ncbi:LANO_0F05050g1_1 [Lachancea nothofagi CBS 11611]|uniref:LANO_0F05050g1_1 n=1 Tax=Lachancea nothofagi CBS 11611 TaxID=1266666 RepID=A0A1G4K802_9SACH|nr:LANO_0F05050g1_1 [Lachancea nothofagi CBS 11611]
MRSQLAAETSVHQKADQSAAVGLASETRASRIDNSVRNLRLNVADTGAAWVAALEFANAIRAVKASESLRIVETDVFAPLLQACASNRENQAVCADLLAVVFACCAAHRDLAHLARDFALSVGKNPTQDSQLRGICGTVNMSPDYKPGIFSVLAKLDFFDSLNTDVFQSLKLGLGSVLRMAWIPLWTHLDLETDLYSAVLNHNLVFATTQEDKLDYLIASLAPDPLQCHSLRERDSKPLEFFLYKVACRTLTCLKHVPESFGQYCQEIVSHSIDNDCFRKLNHSVAFNLSVFMEVVDHPTLNFLQEPHLTSLLNGTLRRIRDLCDQGHIQTLHLELGKMGSTQSLLGILNILQYILARFLLSVGNLMLNAQHFNNDKKNWALLQSPYHLPQYFDDVVPKISPVSRSAFSFDNNQFESGLQATKLPATIFSLLDSLNCLVSTNQRLLEYYENRGIELSTDIKQPDQSDGLTIIGSKSNLETLELIYISNVSTLLLSQQLLDSNCYGVTVGRYESRVQSKLLSTNTKRCFESIIIAFKGTSLFHFIKFSARMSLTELSLQKVSMQVLSHIFFDVSFSVAQSPSLSNKLTQQALYDHIVMWNDGSDSYQRFFSDVFKIPTPSVSNVQTELPALLASVFQDQSSPPSRNAPMLPGSKASRNVDSKRSGPASRYNAHATSFVPSSKSRQGNENYHDSENVAPRSRNRQLSSSSTEFPRMINGPSEEFSVQNTPFSNEKQLPFCEFNDSVTPLSSAVSNAFSNSTTWDSNCFSQGPLLSPDASSTVVNTGKNYILGGHNRATNNSRAQSVHVDRFDYVRQ